jgi:protein ImuB
VTDVPVQGRGSASMPLNLRPVWLCPNGGQPLPADMPTRWLIESGPERIESGWWDGKDVARDYYIVRAAHGARWWVYRDRRPPHRWYLHGWFG